MPLPALAGLAVYLGTAIRAATMAAGAAVVLAEAKDQVALWLLSDDGRAMITGRVNAAIAEHGLDLHFRDVFSKEAVVDDLDRFLANRLNAKAGTNFKGIKNLDRDGILTELGAVVANKISQETGARITNIYPVARLRDELGTELARQFEGENLAEGALFPRAAVVRVEAAIGRKLGKLEYNGMPGGTIWGPPRDEKHAVKRAKGRARQAKYRKTHRQTWTA